MASINGLTLKNVKTWMGREGEAAQGDLYLDNEKICFWSQDGNGGIDNYDFVDKYSENKFRKLIKDIYKDKPIEYENQGKTSYMEYDADLLLSDIWDLQDLERLYTTVRSEGKGGFAVIQTAFIRSISSLSKKEVSLSDNEILSELEDEISSFKNYYGNTGVTIRIFRSYDDFNIGEPIKKEELYRFSKLKDVYRWDTLILNDKIMSLEEFKQLDSSKQNEFLNMDVIASNKNNIYYEKEYFLNISKQENSKDEIELDER